MNRYFAFLVLALITGVICTAQVTSVSMDATASSPDNQYRSSLQNPLADTCFSTYSSGSGPSYFKWCVSQNGNIVSIESPKGMEHIHGAHIQEGYAVCDSYTDPMLAYWDFADGGSSGWNAPTVIQPNGPNTFPLTIERTTTDGMFQLNQVFSQNASEKIVTIKMTVDERGCIGTCGAGVFVFRFANIDADNSSTNWFDQGAESAWGYNSGSPGVILYATAPAASLVSKRAWFDGAGAFLLSDGPPTQCNGNGTSAPFQGDGAVEVYQFFQESVSSPGTVGFEYKRF